jgi:hypothetical protein
MLRHDAARLADQLLGPHRDRVDDRPTRNASPATSAACVRRQIAVDDTESAVLAMQIAVSRSVTVSIAVTQRQVQRISRVRRVRTLTSREHCDAAGTNSVVEVSIADRNAVGFAGCRSSRRPLMGLPTWRDGCDGRCAGR